MKKNICILLFLFHSIGNSFAQDKNDTLLAKNNKMIPLPTVSINFGINSLFSDVALSGSGPSAFTQFGYQLTITQRISKFLNVSFDLYTGSVYGEEQRKTTNLNFRTAIFSQHLNVEYNFYPLLKPNAQGRQLIRPYLGLGVGVISFRSKGDMNAADGTPYQYWSDGNIYAEVEGTISATEATLLERDFQYETELRDANLDGLRKYPQTAFSLPINGGVRFQVSKNVGLNAAFTYALNFSDMLDNVSSESVGDRQGNTGNDNHFFASIGVSFFLGTTKPSTKPQFGTDELADDKNHEQETRAAQSAESNVTVVEYEKRNATSSVDKLNRLQKLSNTQHSMAFETSEMLQQTVLVSSKLTETTDEIKGKLKDSIKLSKVDKEGLSASLKKQSAISEQLSELASNYADQTKTLRKEAVLSSEIIEKREKLLAEIEAVNKQFSEAEKAFSKGLKKVKSGADAVAIVTDLQKRIEERKAALSSIVQQQQQTAQVEKVELLEKRIELIGQLYAENRTANNASKSIGIAEHQQAIGEEISALAQQPSATKEQIETLDKKFQLTVTQSTATDTDGQSEGEMAQPIGTEEVKKEASTTAISEEKTPSTKEVAEQKETASSFSKEAFENASPKKTDGFHWADVDQSGLITPDEVLHIIDMLFEGDSPHSVEDIQSLIDHFFDQ